VAERVFGDFYWMFSDDRLIWCGAFWVDLGWNLRVLWVIDCACKLGFMLSKNSLILEGLNWGFVVDILFKWYLDVLTNWGFNDIGVVWHFNLMDVLVEPNLVGLVV